MPAQDLAAMAASSGGAVAIVPAAPRPRYTYRIPQKARMFANDPESVTMQPISIDEEQTAIRVSEATKNPVVYEFIKHSIVSVNGRQAGWEEREKMLERASPAVRRLLLKAYDEIHSVAPEVEADFLSSRLMEV